MEITFVAGYNDQTDGLIFVFSHREKQQWQLFKVKAADIAYLNKPEGSKAETAEEITPEVV